MIEFIFVKFQLKNTKHEKRKEGLDERKKRSIQVLMVLLDSLYHS